MKKRIIFAVMFLLWSSCAFAAISEDVVQAAWAKISKADGFKTVPITYEKDTSPNAWVKFKSQKDFSVHVTKGLMKILNTEEQIAGVLGHEIGHVRLGHYNKGVGRNIGWTVLGYALGRAGGIAQAVGSVGMNLAESGFSRGQEVEADDYGTELLKKAGYDPMGLYRAMKAFADNKYVTQPNGFNSHPPTARRLKHLMDKAKEVRGN
ncbi:MAG: M48 family metalloprotease [Synergistaceae bacterium]|nr:M48 family metalloprotease [Synergistaceae bacterium]